MELLWPLGHAGVILFLGADSAPVALGFIVESLVSLSLWTESEACASRLSSRALGTALPVVSRP